MLQCLSKQLAHIFLFDNISIKVTYIYGYSWLKTLLLLRFLSIQLCLCMYSYVMYPSIWLWQVFSCDEATMYVGLPAGLSVHQQLVIQLTRSDGVMLQPCCFTSLPCFMLKTPYSSPCSSMWCGVRGGGGSSGSGFRSVLVCQSENRCSHKFLVLVSSEVWSWQKNRSTLGNCS